MSESSDYAQQAAHWKQWAPFYDTDSDGHLPADSAVALLAELADGGPALELGIGAGRLALPLAQRGIPVTGIDASREMLAKLDERRGRLPIETHLADMADFRLPAAFPLAYVAASTLFLLTSSKRQTSCLRRIAATLTADGRFVIEAALPSALAAGREQVIVRHVNDEHVRLTVRLRRHPGGGGGEPGPGAGPALIGDRDAGAGEHPLGLGAHVVLGLRGHQARVRPGRRWSSTGWDGSAGHGGVTWWVRSRALLSHL